jgi:hypothetical protein
MGHAKVSELDDLADVLDAIRALAEIQEPRPCIFYLRRTPFLHFHTSQGNRWADVKDGADWGAELAIPFGAGRGARTSFLRAVRARHRTCVALLPAPRRKT